MSKSQFGIGLYSAPEAARMIGMHASKLRRWLQGYHHHGKFEERLWLPQYPPEDEDGLFLGFRDLIEARIIHALRECRIGLPTIRACIERARSIVGDERPFSTQEFKTDGRTIFLEITRDLDEPIFIDLKRSQGVFKRVVEPSLKDLDFDSSGASRWWLIHGRKSIVADPTYSFGQPIIADFNIPTARIVEAMKAEGSAEKVARIYEIKPSLVRDALEYERSLTMQKAA